MNNIIKSMVFGLLLTFAAHAADGAEASAQRVPSLGEMIQLLRSENIFRNEKEFARSVDFYEPLMEVLAYEKEDSSQTVGNKFRTLNYIHTAFKANYEKNTGEMSDKHRAVARLFLNLLNFNLASLNTIIALNNFGHIVSEAVVQLTESLSKAQEEQQILELVRAIEAERAKGGSCSAAARGK